MNFGSHTDSVVAAAAALVNAVTAGSKQGRPYQPPSGPELRRAVQQALLTGSRQPVALPEGARLAAFTELGQAIRPVFEKVAAGEFDRAAGLANDLLQRFQPSPYLDRHDGQPWHLHFHGHSGRDRSGWGGGISVGLATVLGSEYADRLGVCHAPACDRVYVDTSKNGARRFCSVPCQNRVKAAAHRARSRA